MRRDRITVRYFNALEQKKQKDEGLATLKKLIADVNARLEQQRNLYEAVCTDRNLSLGRVDCISNLDSDESLAVPSECDLVTEY